ncbi:MAG: site-specific integrase [Bryobacteraceae bacterium]
MPKAFKVTKDGKTYYRCQVPLPGGGRKWVQSKTKREAEQRAAEEEQKFKMGLDPDARTETVANFMRRFLDYIKPNDRNEYGVAPSTHADYRYHVEHHIIPELGDKRVQDLTTRDVDLFLRKKADAGLAPASVDYIHRVLRRGLNFAVDWRVIDRNPASSRTRTAKQRKRANTAPDKIRALTPNQAQDLLTAFEGDKYEALIVTAITTGARPGELLALQWGEVDLAAAKITIKQAIHRTKRKRGEKGSAWVLRQPKTPGSRRTLSIPDITVAALHQQRQDQMAQRATAGDRWIAGDFVFTTDAGTPPDVTTVLHRFQKICTAANLPQLRLYDLRHTHASLLIADGKHPKLIAERLGHSSIKITMDTYGHLFDGGDREASDAMEKTFGSESIQNRSDASGTLPIGSRRASRSPRHDSEGSLGSRVTGADRIRSN